MNPKDMKLPSDVWGNVRRKSWEEGRRMAFVSGLEF